MNENLLLINWQEVIMERLTGIGEKYVSLNLSHLVDIWSDNFYLADGDDYIAEYVTDFRMHIDSGEWVGALRAYDRLQNRAFSNLLKIDAFKD